MTINIEDDETGLSIANVAMLGLLLGISLLLVFFVKIQASLLKLLLDLTFRVLVVEADC